MILYRGNSWVITGSMVKLLEAFNHWIVRRIMGEDGLLRRGGRFGMDYFKRGYRVGRVVANVGICT